MALFVNNMSKKNVVVGFLLVLSLSLILVLEGCCNRVTTTVSEDFVDNLSEFHATFFERGVNRLQYDNMALYVDCSTCIAMGQSSNFFQALVPCWVNAAKEYYSIKGSEITKENDDTFSLLRSIQEVNYADIKTAIDLMSKADHESVLLTDGEFYQSSIAKGNINIFV